MRDKVSPLFKNWVMWGTILALNDQLADWLKANLGAEGFSVP